jgi:glyoxalase family protein
MVLLGLHHVTALAGDPQRNLDFYTRQRGMRLVKRTVNFDDPGSYHLYFSASYGEPGSLLTFFPWVTTRKPVAGSGTIVRMEVRGQGTGADPDGVAVEWVGKEGSGIESVTLCVNDAPASAKFFREVLGFEGDDEVLEAPLGGVVELLHSPGMPRGKMAAGSIHHVAFRVADEESQRAWRERLIQAGVRVSPVKDRNYFHSIYFREPGGVLLEIATDGPGFAIDEEREHLGEKLCLPPWLEASRESIEKRLPKLNLTVPHG